MGIYYSVSVAFGFPAPPVPEGEYTWDFYEEITPPGFHFVQGGDLMNGEQERAVIGLPHHIKEIFWSGRSDYFGIYKLDNFVEVTDEERAEIVAAARELGIDDQHIGYYVVSSVG